MLMLPEYLYTPATGWTLLPAGTGWLFIVAPHGTAPGRMLAASRYVPLAESSAGRLGVGHFLVWQAPPRCPADWPRYAVEILQYEDECIVWVATLPDLWEFLRLYGTIGVLMHPTLPGDEDDEDEEDFEDDEDGEDDGVEVCGAHGWICPDCLAEDAAREARGAHDDA